MVLFIVENIFLGWGYYLLIEEERSTNNCLWNICGEYIDASYDAGVCLCYDYDLLGDLVVAKTQYIE